MVAQPPKVEIPQKNPPLDRPLRGGIVGAGFGFIGNVHVESVRADGNGIWVAGAPDRDPEVGKQLWKTLLIPKRRTYGSLDDLLAAEALIKEEPQVGPDDEPLFAYYSGPLDWVSICTENFLHHPMAKKVILAGLNVMCEKPLVRTVEEAQELVDLVEQHRVVFGVTHTYTGHPIIQLALELIASGVIGDIEEALGWYLQEWLRELLERELQQQATWRTDKQKAGRGGALGDIMVHIYQKFLWLTRARALRVRARLRTAVEGRKTDDQAFAEVQAAPALVGAPPIYFNFHALQTVCGEQNNFGWRICGTKGTLIWEQEKPEVLTLRRCGEPDLVYRRDPNTRWASAEFKRGCRLPGGHGEAYTRAKGNVYARFFADIVKRQTGGVFGQDYGGRNTPYPNVYDGFAGVAFINAAADSHESGGGWVEIPQVRSSL